MPDELCYLSIAEAAPLLKSRQLSPVELINAFLHRIEAIDSRIHSFVLVTGEEALRQARAAETEIAAGRYRGPMHGIPIGLKDLIETAGIRTTAHSRVLSIIFPPKTRRSSAALQKPAASYWVSLVAWSLLMAVPLPIRLGRPYETRGIWSMDSPAARARARRQQWLQGW